jgi:polar amino acid transport system permease protein
MSVTVWSTPGPGARGVHPGRVAVLERSAVTLAILGGGIAFLLLAPAYRYEWGRLWAFGGPGWRLVTEGLVTTLWISAIGMLLGTVVGFAGGLARLSRRPAVQQVGTVYVELFRGTPFLVQLMVANYCVAPAVASVLGELGAPASWSAAVQQPVVVGLVSMALFSGAYITEIVRAAIQSIDPGQTEAAFSQGMSRGQVLRLVLIPQALRRMVPPLTGELVSLVKDSSLLSIIAVEELRYHADRLSNSTHKTYEVILPIAILYLVITFPLSRLAQRLERRLA